MRDMKLYLQDILEAMAAIESFVGDMDIEALRNNDMISSAVIRKFEVIGEATKNVSEDITKKYPVVPWKKMAGMRDRLIHSYFGIKYDLVWRTIKEDIPRIKPLIQNILNDLSEGEIS